MKTGTLLIVLSVTGLAQDVARSQSGDWPRVIENNGNRIVVYQPLPDSFDGVTLSSRVAVSVRRPMDDAPSFGALWVHTRLGVDLDRDTAHVVSVHIERTRFAELSDHDVRSLVHFLEADALDWNPPVSLSRLHAEVRRNESQQADYRNAAPKVLVSDSPAILLLLDGPPRLQDLGSGGLQRVVNTALPVIFESKTGQYWFYGSSVWFTTRDLLNGAWTSADHAPSAIAALVRDTDTLDSPPGGSGTGASAAQLRSARIVVSTEPAELIVTEGHPQYSPLVGGEILYVTNTHSDIFLDVASQRHYIAISGRWFAGPSIQGPWTFVSPESLPPAFTRIPENSTKAGVLAFVAGTERAKDALLDNAIPQTAEVSRDTAKIEVQYDGAPQFARVPNTALEYAENTPSEVIRSGGHYYACEEGVWYAAPSPNGPWAVSDVRPVGLEDIPPSSPVYNTQFVYIYDATPYVVHVGYLPGYRWSFPYHGAIYYGTGWRYQGWFGRHYYPRPATWGFYPRYDPWTGWGFGMSWTPGWLGMTAHWGPGWAGQGPWYGPVYHLGFWGRFHAGGWFGPGGYRPYYWRPPGRPATGRAGVRPPRPRGRQGNNLYVRPGNGGVRPQHGTVPGMPAPEPRPRGPQVRPDLPGPARPGPGTSGIGRPGTGRPRGTRPDGPGVPGRGPGQGRPSAGNPEPATPGGGGGRGTGRPDAGSPNSGRPDSPVPGVGAPDSGGAGRGGRGVGSPGIARPGGDGRGNGRRGNPRPRANSTPQPGGEK